MSVVNLESFLEIIKFIKLGHSNKQIQTSNKIADSFPGMDGYLQAPVPQQTTHPAYNDISKAPKWMKKPVSAKFGVSNFNYNLSILFD